MIDFSKKISPPVPKASSPPPPPVPPHHKKNRDQVSLTNNGVVSFVVIHVYACEMQHYLNASYSIAVPLCILYS